MVTEPNGVEGMFDIRHTAGRLALSSPHPWVKGANSAEAPARQRARVTLSPRTPHTRPRALRIDLTSLWLSSQDEKPDQFPQLDPPEHESHT